MSGTGSLWLVGGIALVVILGVVIWLFSKGKNFNLTTSPEGQKPEWLRETPPQETLEALQADGETLAVFDHDPGEDLAAPFAEQIEDLVRARLAHTPGLQQIKIDFGTGPDGRLEIDVDGKHYSSVDQIPHPQIKALIKDAIDAYNKS